MRWWRPRRHSFTSDREATEAGADGLESAENWMRHVLERDFPGRPVGRVVIVAEVPFDGGRAATVYTTHSVDALPVDIRGLLGEGLRALDELQIRTHRAADIQAYVDAREDEQ